MPKHIKIITQDDIGGVICTNIYRTMADACFHTKHNQPTIRNCCDNNTTRVILFQQHQSFPILCHDIRLFHRMDLFFSLDHRSFLLVS